MRHSVSVIWQGRIAVYSYHYNDVRMDAVASHITGLTIVYSTVGTGAASRKHQSSASLAFVRGIHRWPVMSPHKWPVTRKMFPFHDVIMRKECFYWWVVVDIKAYRKFCVGMHLIHLELLSNFRYKMYGKVYALNLFTINVHIWQIIIDDWSLLLLFLSS